MHCPGGGAAMFAPIAQGLVGADIEVHAISHSRRVPPSSAVARRYLADTLAYIRAHRDRRQGFRAFYQGDVPQAEKRFTSALAAAERSGDHRMQAASLHGLGHVAIRRSELPRAGEHMLVGRITVQDLIHEWVHHDRNHVRQLYAVVQAFAWTHMGNCRRFADFD